MAGLVSKPNKRSGGAPSRHLAPSAICHGHCAGTGCTTSTPKIRFQCQDWCNTHTHTHTARLYQKRWFYNEALWLGFHVGPKLLESAKERGWFGIFLLFGLGLGWGIWVQVSVSLASLRAPPRCGAQREEGVVRLQSCQQSDIINGASSLLQYYHDWIIPVHTILGGIWIM